MLIPLSSLISDYNLAVRGILHVGAHECEEKGDYDRYGISNVVWVEAMPDVVARVRSRYPFINIHQAVISETDNENVSFHVTNNGQSSSILAFGTHQHHHPHVHVTHTIPLQTTRLDTLIHEKKIPIEAINFLNLDIQGMELSALKSMESYLGGIDYIYTEVNTENVYDGVPLIGEMDAYLSAHGFKRVTQYIYTQFGWGDAFYMRSHPSS